MPGEDTQAGTLQQEEAFSPEQEEEAPPAPSFEDRMEAKLAGFESMLRETDARLRGVHSISDKAIAAIDTMQKSFEERFGKSEKTLSLFQDYLRSTVGDEAAQEIERRQDERQRIEDEARRKYEKPVEPPTSGTTERVTTSEKVLIEAEFWGSVVPELEEYAEQKGIPLELVSQKLPPNRDAAAATKADPHAWRSYVRASKAVIDREAERIKNQAKSRAPIDTTRGGGVPRVDALTAYKEALAKGGALPSREEIDRLTAKYLAGP